MEKLILLTNQYPFGKGEEFLETELPIISRKFDEIIIFATGFSGETKLDRKLPSNASAYSVEISSKWLLRLFTYILFSLASLRFKWVRKGIFRERTFRKQIECVRYSGRGYYLFRHILRILKQKNFLKASNITLYSYWFKEAPISMKMLGQELENQNARFSSLSRAHGYDLYEERNQLGFFPFREDYLEFLDSVFPCSDSGTSYLKNRYPQYANKISTRRLGTKDFGIFPYFRKRGVINIVSCSYVVPVKQLDFLVRVLALAEQRNAFKYTWTHIGAGIDFDNLLELIHKNLTPSNVVLRGHLENEELMQLYLNNSFDLFINVSISEGIPVSVMEAMSGGIPCIAPRVGGIPEIVFDQKNGYLFDAKSNEEFVLDLIVHFLEESDQSILDLRHQARETWNSLFNGNRNYTAFLHDL